ncbi:hypothetical protein BDM02DRAFT_3187004 [Thelephora ganbajun]|uniref:Uncharacterized protein n=1 Tax=Thelephora ganbajun TaxID=370292 RepID=A0ACB6ZGM5_THEGA|nr:hypothetical protein BDM02DRAFT_3187004 [Thelephora ganbajun]
MSRSTISTTTQVISKYSRAYSTDPTGSQNPDGEWQHFSNPVLKVILDVKRSEVEDRLESFRLRVLWNMNTEGNAMDVDHREFVFEDVDLLLFSTDPSASLQTQLTQGLPLKAVYCDSLVGFRYLHPRPTPPGSSPTYRRFQMDFATTEAASQFVKLVSTVCPCTTTDRVPRTSRGRPQTTLTSAPSSRPRPTPKKVQKPAITQQRKAAGTRTPQTGPSSVISAGSDDSHTLASRSSDPLPEAFPVYSHPAPPVTLDHTLASLFIPPPTPSQGDNSSQSAIPRHFPLASQVFLPSTPILSSSQMLPPTAPITPSQLALQPGIQPPNTQPDAFFEGLMRSPALYDLSKPQLEAVVAQVIREEGFAKLLETLDSMWKLKGFIPNQDS